MGKLPDRFEDWTPPWGENDEDCDAKEAARLIYNARKGEEKAKAAKATEVATLQEKLDDALASKAGTDEETQNELKDLRKKARELEEAAKAPRPEDQRRIDQLEVAIEKGLSLAASRRLVGSDREEIEADALVYLRESGKEVEEETPSSKQAPGNRPIVPRGELKTGKQQDDAGGSEDPAKLDLPPLGF